MQNDLCFTLVLLVESSDAALPLHSVCGELGVDVRHSFVVSDNVKTRMIGKACLGQPVFVVRHR